MLAWGFGDFKGGEIFPWRNPPPPLYGCGRVGVSVRCFASIAQEEHTPFLLHAHTAACHLPFCGMGAHDLVVGGQEEVRVFLVFPGFDLRGVLWWKGMDSRFGDPPKRRSGTFGPLERLTLGDRVVLPPGSHSRGVVRKVEKATRGVTANRRLRLIAGPEATKTEGAFFCVCVFSFLAPKERVVCQECPPPPPARPLPAPLLPARSGGGGGSGVS